MRAYEPESSVRPLPSPNIVVESPSVYKEHHINSSFLNEPCEDYTVDSSKILLNTINIIPPQKNTIEAILEETKDSMLVHQSDATSKLINQINSVLTQDEWS